MLWPAAGLAIVNIRGLTATRGRASPISPTASPIFDKSQGLAVGETPTAPRVLYPQHFNVESLRMAHVWKPAETFKTEVFVPKLIVAFGGD